MFKIALIIGIYAYSIFALGFLSLLTPASILILTLIFIIAVCISYKNKINLNKISLGKFKSIDKLIIILIFIQAIINLIGALGPEISFDSLWYHLTFPKLYLINHAIVYVPGGLLYYSTIPKLTELIYTAELAFGNEILPKLTHFSFGILICIALYKISRKYLNQTFSLLVVLLFYSNLVVDWESMTAYIDLARTFFELMALWGFLDFLKFKKEKSLIISAVMLGLAISTKLTSMATIPIYIVLIFMQKIQTKDKIKESVIFSIIAVFIVSPWLIFSFIHTGNPVYPLISNYNTGQGKFLLSPIYFIKSLFSLFTKSSDPVSPFYIIIFPLILFYFKKLFKSDIRPILIFSTLSLLIWYVSPQAGEARYFLPFLPPLSLVSIYLVKTLGSKYARNYLIILLVFLAIVSIGYRAIANKKFIPVVFGSESKATFLTNNLNFSYGDFYDTDGYFKTHLKPSDTVLLYGFHNLYYIDFNFIDSSWVKKGDMFDYIATQNTTLPSRFSFWKLVYYNSKTHVRLYSTGGTTWVY